MGAIKKLQTFIRPFSSLASEERRNALGMLADFTWSFFRHGVYPHQYINTDFNKLKNSERAKVLTYRRWCHMVRAMADPKYIHFLQNKKDFNRKFCDFVKRKWISSAESGATEIRRFIESQDTVIIKPATSWEGEGVRKLDSQSIGDIDRLLNEMASQEYIIEECISNHPDLAFNTALNTLRITTIMDKTGEFFLIKPFLRAGVGNSIVDNYNAGGVEYEIDPDTGIIVSKGFCKGEAIHIFHPGTNIQMIGKSIPHWHEAVELVKHAHMLIPQCRYVGWDVAVTANDIQLIEGNHDAGFFGFEYFGTRRWYEIIKKYLS